MLPIQLVEGEALRLRRHMLLPIELEQPPQIVHLRLRYFEVFLLISLGEAAFGKLFLVLGRYEGLKVDVVLCLAWVKHVGNSLRMCSLVVLGNLLRILSLRAQI